MTETPTDEATFRTLEWAQSGTPLHTLVFDAARVIPLLQGRVSELETRAEQAEARLAALRERHATMRTALSFLHRWPDGMVAAGDVLTVLDADAALADPHA